MKSALNPQSVRETDSQEKMIEDKYAALGITVQPITPICDNVTKVYSVRLDFSDSEWLDLLNTEGELLGACCGTISEIRDHLIQALREDRWLRANELRIVAGLIESHGCESSRPLDYLTNLWQTIKADADGPRKTTVDLADMKSVMRAMDELTRIYAVHQFLPYTTGGQSEYVKTIVLSRLLPLVGALHKHLTEAQIPPITGYAVFLDGKLCGTDSNPLVFNTQEIAEEVRSYVNGTVHKVSVDLDGVRIVDG